MDNQLEEILAKMEAILDSWSRPITRIDSGPVEQIEMKTILGPSLRTATKKCGGESGQEAGHEPLEEVGPFGLAVNSTLEDDSRAVEISRTKILCGGFEDHSKQLKELSQGSGPRRNQFLEEFLNEWASEIRQNEVNSFLSRMGFPCLPSFSGVNLEDWIDGIEEYFVVYSTIEIYQFSLVAKEWYLSWDVDNNEGYWNKFVKALCVSFENVESNEQLENVDTKEQIGNDGNVKVEDFVSEEEVDMFISSGVQVSSGGNQVRLEGSSRPLFDDCFDENLEVSVVAALDVSESKRIMVNVEDILNNGYVDVVVQQEETHFDVVDVSEGQSNQELGSEIDLKFKRVQEFGWQIWPKWRSKEVYSYLLILSGISKFNVMHIKVESMITDLVCNGANTAAVYDCERCEGSDISRGLFTNESSATLLFQRYCNSTLLHVANKQWQCCYSSNAHGEVSPKSLWQDFKPSIAYLYTEELVMVHSALNVALKAHKVQKRDSGEPFIIHPVKVALILGEIELDWESITAGLLHDVVEDTNVITFERIKEEFDPTGRHIVEGETKVSKLGKLKCEIVNLGLQSVIIVAIEAKQVAAQEDEKAKFIVEKAEQDKRNRFSCGGILHIQLWCDVASALLECGSWGSFNQVSILAAWLGRGPLFVCAQRRDSDARPSFDLTPAQEESLQRLQDWIDVHYDSSVPEHQEVLKSLWTAAFPEAELHGLISEQWKEMDWQVKDPTTDFECGGFISLENLLFFARNFPKSFQDLLQKRESAQLITLASIYGCGLDFVEDRKEATMPMRFHCSNFNVP